MEGMMAKLNAIWKSKTGRDLTTEEAWKMVDVVKFMFENADRNFTEYYENQKKHANH